MDRSQVVRKTEAAGLFDRLHELHASLGAAFKEQFNRSLPFADEVFDRWERAESLGFGKGASIYDSAFVFGDVVVGEDTWIGPFCIIDGSGGLRIGKNCTISAGAQIYTHDNVMQTLTGGTQPIERSAVSIGDCTYVGPNAVIKRGVTIGRHCLVGTGSYVNRDVPDHTIVAGTPARAIGEVHFADGEAILKYHSKS